MSTETLQERAKSCICKMCGGPIEVRRIVYNKYGGTGLELYCPTCERIEYGTQPTFFHYAKAFVEEIEFDYFTEMEEGLRHDQLNIAKVCEILSWMMAKQQAEAQNKDL